MNEYKIKQTEIDDNNVKSSPDILKGDPQDIKNVFDKLPELIADKFNSLVDNLYSKKQVDEKIDAKIVEIASADMAKAVYDKNGDGIVDKADLALDSEKLGGKAANEYALENETVKKSGDVMTGALTLHAEPSEKMHAATKHYVDSKTGMDLLWQNAVPTSDFAAQTIELNLANYKCITIVFRVAAAGDEYGWIQKTICEKNVPYVASLHSGHSGKIDANLIFRKYSYNNNGVIFENGSYGVVGSNYATQNNVLIPVKIYGIK